MHIGYRVIPFSVHQKVTCQNQLDSDPLFATKFFCCRLLLTSEFSKEGVYYYNTYNNNQINVIDMHKEDLDSKELKIYAYNDTQVFKYEN